MLVLLKDKLDNVFYDNNLDYVLDFIVSPEAGKKRKILLILDGLDEYDGNVSSLLEYLGKKHKVLSNMKVILTTRLVGNV